MRVAVPPRKDEILGFHFQKSAGPGVTHSYRTPAGRFTFPDFSMREIRQYVDPEQEFQDIVDNPPLGNLAYYVGLPFHSLKCTDLIHPGEKFKKSRRG